MKQGLRILLALTYGAGTAMGFGVTFVSTHGVDSVSCGITGSPCRTIAAALVNTETGGLVLLENIFTPTVPVLQITADCTIRGVALQASGGAGIRIAASGLQVHLEDVTIQGSSYSNGVHVVFSGVDLTASRVTVTGAPVGFNFAAANTTFTGDRVHVLGSSGAGIYMTGGSGSVRDSLIRGPGAASGSTGIYVAGVAGAAGTLMTERSEISFNGLGLDADAPSGAATLRLSSSVVTGNATGSGVLGASLK